MPGTKKPGRWVGGQWVDYVGWSQHCSRATRDIELSYWAKWPGAGIGVACGNVVGIDMDIVQDPNLVFRLDALAKEMLGETTALRIGMAPKRLLVFRARVPFAGFKRHPLEILGLGQQFVAHSVHPGTGRPYEWPEDNLGNLDITDLPEVTEAMCREWLDEAYKLIPPELRPKSLGGTGEGEHVTNPMLQGTFAAINDALQYIRNDDLDYDSWMRVGFALKGAVGDAAEGLFAQWSASSRKNDPQATAKMFASARPTQIGAGTIYHLAKEAGWTPRSDLILNAVNEALAAQPVHPAAKLIDRFHAKVAAFHEAQQALDAERAERAQKDPEPAATDVGVAGVHDQRRSREETSGGATIGEASAEPQYVEGTTTTDFYDPEPEATPETEAPAQPQPEREPKAEPAIDVYDVPGALRGFVDWCSSSAIKPQPFFALAAALVVVGTLMGRKYATESNLRSNLYVVCLGGSGVGKNHPLICINQAFFAMGMQQYLGGGDIASGSGMISALAQSPSMLFTLDEIGKVLTAWTNSKAPKHVMEIWTKMMQLFSSAGSVYRGAEYADKKTNKRHDIQQPNLSVLGCSVPGRFWEAFAAGDASDGGLARFLVFESQGMPPRNLNPTSIQVPDDLVAALKSIEAGVPGHTSLLNHAHAPEVVPTPFIVPFSFNARLLINGMNGEMDRYIDRANARSSGDAAILNRYGEHVQKLALIRAVARDPREPIIQDHDVLWARELVDVCLARMITSSKTLIADTQVEKEKKQVLAKIVDAGENGITHSDVMRKCQSLKGKVLKDIIQDLYEQHAIEIKDVPGRTKPTRWYYGVADLEEA